MDQVQVLSAVCKKLNNDIESLANQTSMRESAIAKLDSNQQAYDEQLRQLNMDLQIKLTKTDTITQKLQSEVEQMSHGLREVMNSQQDSNRSNVQRYQELKLEVKITKVLLLFFNIFYLIENRFQH
jgi:chromosome segregation ATPase